MIRRAFAFALMIALISTLFILPAPAEEQILPIVPYAVSDPGQVDELWAQDIGRSFIIGSRMEPTYQIDIHERGYLIFRKSRFYSVKLYYNASRTAPVSKWSCWGGYLLDPGTYYLSVSMSTSPADKVLYSYFLPLSAYVSVTEELKGDHADITVNLLGEGLDADYTTIKWIDDWPGIKKASTLATEWKHRAENQTFTVTKNGNYSVHIYSTQEKWKQFLAVIDFRVEGIVDATVTPEPTPTPKPTATPKPTEKPVTSVTVSGGKYKLSSNTATFTGPASKKVTKLTIPATVKANGKSYKVTTIKASACKGLKKLTDLTIGKYVWIIGESAFRDCKALETITIKTAGLTATTVGAYVFKNIKPTATFKCPSKKVKAYAKLFRQRGAGEKATFK